MARIVDRQEKKESLIRAAASTFAKSGFSKTTISDIAAAADVGKGTVYEYFASKEELFFAVYRWVNEKVSRRIEKCIDPAIGAIEQIEILSDESAMVIREMRDQYSLNLDFWAASRGTSFEGLFKREIAKLYRGYRVLLATVIRRGQESGEISRDHDADQLAAAIVGAYDGLGIQYWIEDSLDLLGCARSLTAALIRGIVKTEP